MTHQFILSQFFIFIFVLVASIQQPVHGVFLEKELVIDLGAVETSYEWIILETDPNRIFYFSFIIPNGHFITRQQISSSLTIVDKDKPDFILFPLADDNDRNNILSPFYSTGNAVSIKLIKSAFLSGFQIKIEKAVSCPFNIGGSTSCGRVVDDLSCYCGLFTYRKWADTKSFCVANNMTFVSIESYEEDLALFAAFGGPEVLFLGASDSASEGKFIWDSTGRVMSPGYQGWATGYPTCACGTTSNDCLVYGTSTNNTLPSWIDASCTASYGGICESQP